MKRREKDLPPTIRVVAHTLCVCVSHRGRAKEKHTYCMDCMYTEPIVTTTNTFFLQVYENNSEKSTLNRTFYSVLLSRLSLRLQLDLGFWVYNPSLHALTKCVTQIK